MSIWGKILGGAAGFALGGPLGALIGAVAGHAVDRMRDARQTDVVGSTKSIAFTIAVIALGAKMAQADGAVNRSESDAFEEVFRVPRHGIRNVARDFCQARGDSRGFEPLWTQAVGKPS